MAAPAVNISRLDTDLIAEAMREGYRVTVHAGHFPYRRWTPGKDGQLTGSLVHYDIDDGARAVFCSEALGKVLAAAQS